MSGGEFYFNVDITYLLAGVILFYLLVAVFSENSKTVLSQGEMIRETVVENRGKRATFRTLIDTGCRLKEPITARPVIIVPLSLGQTICECPIELKKFFEKEKKQGDFTEKGLKIIPFYTVAGQWEIMPGFDAEKLIIDGKSYSKNEFVVAVAEYSLSDNFDAIINPEIIIGGKENEVDKMVFAEA